MAKSEKRQLPVVKARVGYESKDYAPSGFRFAFVSSPENGRQQCTALNSCRENVNNNVKRHVVKAQEKDAPLDRTRLRLLIAGPSVDSKAKLFNAKAMLNLCEDVAGWKRSSITTVKHETYPNAWLITGPGEWMMAPQLLSAATLVLRVVTENGPIVATTYDDFEKAMHQLVRKCADDDCEEYLSIYWDKMYVLLKYAKEIFAGLDSDDLWGKSYEGSFGYSSGIERFWNDSHQYHATAAKARERFKKLVKEHLPRRK